MDLDTNEMCLRGVRRSRAAAASQHVDEKSEKRTRSILQRCQPHSLIISLQAGSAIPSSYSRAYGSIALLHPGCSVVFVG